MRIAEHVGVAIVCALVGATSGRIDRSALDAIAANAMSPPLQAAVLSFEGSGEEAVARAKSAGATHVYFALPPGHAWIPEGAEPEPIALGLDSAGRIRTDQGVLPLPEGLGGIVRLDAKSVGPGNALAGLDVVMTFADPAAGAKVGVPGVAQPVDRAEVLAVALGADHTGAYLREPSILLSAAAAFLLGGLWSLTHRRMLPWASAASAVGGCVGIVGAAWVLRTHGWCVPVVGLMGATLIPAGMRLALVSNAAFRAIDRMAVRVGAPRDEQALPAGLAGLVEVATLYAPGLSVATWGADGKIVARHDGDAPLPDAGPIPATPQFGPSHCTLPILDEGRIVGAIALASTTIPAAELARLGQLLVKARRLELIPRPPGADIDPILAREALAQQAVRRAVGRADRWERLLADVGVPLGVFDVSGGLVSASSSVRAKATGQQLPLIDALVGLGRLAPDRVRSELRLALTSGAPRRMNDPKARNEVVVTPIGTSENRDGFLLQMHDVSPHRDLDELKNSTLRLLAFEVRNALAAIEGYGVMIAGAPNDDERDAFLERLQNKVADVVRIVESGEALETAGVGDRPVQPVFTEDLFGALREALASRGVELASPNVSRPIAARGPQLVEAVVALVQGMLGLGARVRITMSGDPVEVRLTIVDIVGGLPPASVTRWAESRDGAVDRFRVAIEEMGGRVEFDLEQDAGMKTTAILPYF